MSDADFELTAEQKAAQDAVRVLSRPAPDAAFRTRLREEFASGALARRAATARPPVPFPRRPTFARSFAFAAAAAFAVAFGVNLNRGPGWSLTRLRETGPGARVIVGGRPFAASDTRGVAGALGAGKEIRLEGGASMEVMAPRQLAIEITPGTQVVLPKTPGRWMGRSSRAVVRAGELRITTGSEFHGAALAVSTPEADVRVTGTTLAVICDSTGTCVCVCEGRVGVARKGQPAAMVEPGHLRFIPSDINPPEIERQPDHRHHQKQRRAHGDQHESPALPVR